MKNEPVLLKKTRDDELKHLRYKTETHDHENLFKSLKIDSEYFKKKYKSLNKKKLLLIITEILIGSAATISSSTMGSVNPGSDFLILSSTALLTSFDILRTNENISKLKIRYNKLRHWMFVITLLCEKIFKTSMVDKKIDENGAEDLKKIYNQYFDQKKRNNDENSV